MLPFVWVLVREEVAPKRHNSSSLQSQSPGAAHYWWIQTVPKQTLCFKIHCTTSELARHTWSYHTHLSEGFGDHGGLRARRLCRKPDSCWNIFHIKEFRAEGGMEQPCWRSCMFLIPSLATAGERPQMVSRQRDGQQNILPSSRVDAERHHDTLSYGSHPPAKYCL